ncbi:O-antigen ligase family protein [Microbacterium lushaniae]|nr:O-antigen ligase family protein [Microbacterium lushaniae]KAA9152698.1 O-antigen ligase family protein [Microbacterium lushaniae]
MSRAVPLPLPGLPALLASASFARAYTFTTLATVFSAFAIQRVAGEVTFLTIVAGLCALGVGMLIARRAEYSLVRLAPTTVLMFLVWTLVTLAWTTDNARTVSGWLALAATALLAVVVALVRDTLQTVRALGDVLRWLLSISVGVEILSGILLDTPFGFLGIQGRIAELGPIQGIFGTRNLLGFATVIALITFLIEYRTLSVRTGVAVFSVVLGGVTAVLTDSPTVFVLAVAVGVAAAALAVVRSAPPERRSVLQWTIGTLVVIAVGIGYLLRNRIITVLGAGTDFSLRTDLWMTLLPFVRFRPVEGWGWYGPWTATDYPFIAINLSLGESHASALNAYLDVLLQTGWVGLLLFLALALIALIRAWLVASERRSVVHAWTPLVLVALLVDSLFESFTLSGFGWFMLVLCAVRAGQSRSWRERVGAMDDPADPGLLPLPGDAQGLGGLRG